MSRISATRIRYKKQKIEHSFWSGVSAISVLFLCCLSTLSGASHRFTHYLASSLFLVLTLKSFSYQVRLWVPEWSIRSTTTSLCSMSPECSLSSIFRRLWPPQKWRFKCGWRDIRIEKWTLVRGFPPPFLDWFQKRWEVKLTKYTITDQSVPIQVTLASRWVRRI